MRADEADDEYWAATGDAVSGSAGYFVNRRAGVHGGWLRYLRQAVALVWPRCPLEKKQLPFLHIQAAAEDIGLQLQSGPPAAAVAHAGAADRSCLATTRAT